MNNTLINVTIKATGKKIKVYRRSLGGFVDYADCKTIYGESELIFPKPKN